MCAPRSAGAAVGEVWVSGAGWAYRGGMRHLALLALLAACSAAPAPTRCTPGASVACVCPGVGAGAQVCAADGASYGACVCAVDAGGGSDATVTPGGDVASGVDAVAVADVPVMDAGGGEDRGEVADVVAVVDAGPVMLCGDASVNVVEGTYLTSGTNGGRFANCGACGVLCASSQRCTAGACGPRCPNGERVMCDGRTVRLSLGESDGGVVNHCGACGNACPAGWLCDGCVCVPR